MKTLMPAMDGASREAATAWFFENSADGFAISRGGIVLSVNRAWCEICGCEPADAVGGGPTDFVHPDDMHLFAASQAELRETGQATYEARVRRSGKRWVWVRVNVKRGDDGFALIVIHDITEERAKQAQAEATDRAQELLRTASGVYVWRFDPETGRYLAQPDNRRPRETMGGDGERVLTQRGALAEIHPDDAGEVAAAFLHAAQTGEAGEVWYRHGEVEGCWSRYRATWRGVRPHANGLWEVIGLAQDMTEILDARDAAQHGERIAAEAAASQSRFLANMSHEIRTPMNGVVGVLHILRDEALSEQGRALLDEAVACGQMLSQLVNDLLDYSKIEAGRLEMAPEPVDAGAAAASVANILRPQMDAKGLYLRTEIDADMGLVSLDPVRFRQVLFNLLGNAAKFTLRGGVTVRVAGHGEGAGHRLRVEIEDTGVGISLAAQGHLFERFQQGDGSTTREFGGTGLGLVITRRLAELMEGEVGFTSVEGAGSTFWIEIAAPRAHAAPAAPVEPGGVLDGLNLLIVDDNATNRLVAGKMLEALGATVESADNGALGVECAARGGYDLIFMDVQMPVMDGIEATRRIRALPSPAGRTPILAMTANVMDHQVAQYLAAGMAGVVAKPLSPGAILAEILRIAEAADTDGAWAA